MAVVVPLNWLSGRSNNTGLNLATSNFYKLHYLLDAIGKDAGVAHYKKQIVTNFT